jgi:hypothetical protein
VPETTRREHDAATDLPEFLAARARGASDLRLAADTTIGLVAVLVAIIWPFPLASFVIAAGGCFLGFGVWGIADRELTERASTATPRQARLLRLVKLLATVVGAAAAAVLMIRVMAVLIGTVIS